MHGEWNTGFGSFLLKIPLIGMRKKSHHFLRSRLERGVSLNFNFFYSHSTFRRKVGVEFAFLFPLEVGVGRSDVDVVVEFASLSRVSLFPKLIAKGTPMDASIPRKPPYCAAPHLVQQDIVPLPFSEQDSSSG